MVIIIIIEKCIKTYYDDKTLAISNAKEGMAEADQCSYSNYWVTAKPATPLSKNTLAYNNYCDKKKKNANNNRRTW